MTETELKDMAAAGVLSAETLRQVFRGRKDDEGIKRFALSGLGFKFCRRRGKWHKGPTEIDPSHDLDTVLSFLCASP